MKSARLPVTCVPGDEDGTSAFYMSPAVFLHDSLNDEFPPPSGAKRASSLKVPPESFFFMRPRVRCLCQEQKIAAIVAR